MNITHLTGSSLCGLGDLNVYLLMRRMRRMTQKMTAMVWCIGWWRLGGFGVSHASHQPGLPHWLLRRGGGGDSGVRICALWLCGRRSPSHTRSYSYLITFTVLNLPSSLSCPPMSTWHCVQLSYAGSMYEQVDMTFENRLKIAQGAAEGLLYLHIFAKPPIIHRDIKPANLLLAEDFDVSAQKYSRIPFHSKI